MRPFILTPLGVFLAGALAAAVPADALRITPSLPGAVDETAPRAIEPLPAGERSLVVLARADVRVSPDGGVTTASAGVARTHTFQLENPGTAAGTYRLLPECRDALTGAKQTPCTVPQPTVTVSPGGSVNVAVTAPGAPAGSAQVVTLRAELTAPAGVSDAVWVDVNVAGAVSTATPAPLVQRVDLNGGPVIERSECVTAAVAPRVAYECGDLRVAYALPAHHTFNRDWAPTLLYNSQHAHPRGTVHADVTIPAGAAVPASVQLSVTRGAGVVESATFPGSDFTPGVPRRLAVQWEWLSDSTGVYPYTLQATANYAAASVRSDTLQGRLVLVNRHLSRFGAGWWMGGWESLSCVDCGSATATEYLWIGGDGSTRIFRHAGQDRWIAPNPGGAPDTLVRLSGAWRRLLNGGGYVEFTTTGRHARTVNRLGQVTEFVLGGNGRIEAIRAPVPAGQGAREWSIYYAPNGKAELISARAPGTADRGVFLGYAGGGRPLTMLVGPARDTTVFKYAADAYSPRIRGMVDARGTHHAFTWDAAGKLASARLHMGPRPHWSQSAPVTPADLVQTFQAGEGRGVGTSVAAAQAYTLLDGPRTDEPDQTMIWLADRGAPRRIRDAGGGETLLTRGDARFPALVTRSVSPTGRVSRAEYDTLGRVVVAVVENPLGDGRHRASTYRYDDRWHAPVTVATYEVSGGTWTPLVGAAHALYDTRGNPVWREQGDFRRRTHFDYDAAGQVIRVRHPHPGTGAENGGGRDSLAYDALGNLRLSVSPLNFHTVIDRDSLGRPSITYTPVHADSSHTEARVRATGARLQVWYDDSGRQRRTVSTGPPITHWSQTGPNRAPNDSPPESVTVETEYDGLGAPLRVARWASPDPAAIGPLVNVYEYDNAGRKISESDGARTQRFRHDPAGNLLGWTPADDAPEITAEYDAFGRVTQRVVPEVSYAAACVVMRVGDEGISGGKEPPGPYLVGPVVEVDGTSPATTEDTAPCFPYPHYPNGAGGRMVVHADTTVNRYDAAGNLVYARNREAIVERSYTPGGLMREDVIRMRTYTGQDFSRHVFALRYEYDVLGRMRMLNHPSNLVATAAPDLWTYDPVTGALATATDRYKTHFQFRQDFGGRTTSIRQSYMGTAAVVDTMEYDLQGRLVKRREYRASNNENLHDDTYRYDARGKLLQVTSSMTSTQHQWYSGLGMLAGTHWGSAMNAAYEYSEYVTDPLGNLVAQRSGSPGWLPGWTTNALQPGVGRVTSSVNGPPAVGYAYSPEESRRSYDTRGNQEWVMQEVRAENDADFLSRLERSRSFYAADGKLRYHQQNVMGVGLDAFNRPEHVVQGVWEEYRYDALGRRIMVRSNREALCETTGGMECVSHVTRAIWMGDQLLWELRAPGESTDDLEALSGVGGRYGRVSYLHGGGIDRPLSIVKDSSVVVPHQNWRGQFARGTYQDGRNSDCQGCMPVSWPGWRTSPWHEDAKAPDIRTWAGSLVDGMRDQSGQMYMRNRYYDPATGQFTQSDPIGIAGGLNSYGFAAGDPVSYADPYGLKVEFENAAARRLWLDLQRMITIGANSRDADERNAASRMRFMVDAIDRSENTLHLNVGRQGGWTGYQVRNRYGGAMTYMPWKGLFNDDARTLIDPVRLRSLLNLHAVVALGHELGHAHAIMYGLTDKVSPALRADNDTRILVGCLPLRTGEFQLPAPCN